MTKPVALSDQEITQALAALPGWAHEDKNLCKRFVFGDFKEALSFLVRVGMHAEQLEHHPQIHNVYNRVELHLNTHDAGGVVTSLDVALAQAIEKFQWTGQ